MQKSIIFLVISLCLGSSYSTTCKGDECDSQCAAYCYGVLNPCMANLGTLQRRIEACESAVTIARIALNDRRLDNFGTSMNLQLEKQNTSQLLLTHGTPMARKLEKNDTFQQLGSKYYYIEKEQKLNWHDALDKCRKMGGHLTSLQSQQELDGFNSQLNGLNRYWIDVTSQFNESEFVSVTKGSKANFLSWAEGEPTKDGKCVDIRTFNGKTTMNDNACSANLFFICEKSFEI
ncbi:C-type lectin 37Db [Drosophila sechellia]|nr:C-type lectin 37Db [Drosophila sechellia]